MLRSRNTPHISGRASDLESQPMSVIEEDQQLYNTQEFPVSGVDADDDAVPDPPRPDDRLIAPAPVQPYENEDNDDALREDIRKVLLKQAGPILSMARQIAGAANLEMHRVIRQEVKEQLIETLFEKMQPELKEKKAMERATQWLKEAQTVNVDYLPEFRIIQLYKLNVFLKIQKPFFYIGTKVDGTLKLVEYSLNLASDAKQQALQIFYCLRKENVYGTSLGYDVQGHDDVMHSQKAQFDKFNVDELLNIVKQFQDIQPVDTPIPKAITADTPVRPISSSIASGGGTGSEGVGTPPSFLNARMMFAGFDVNRVVQGFGPGDEKDIAEWEPRIETHVLETCQIVYDTLHARGEKIGSVEVVQKRMIEDADGADTGSRVLFARVCANRINFSTEMAPKQHYLQARFGRLRQQFALLLVNLRRLRFHDNKFTLETSIPRRTARIY